MNELASKLWDTADLQTLNQPQVFLYLVVVFVIMLAGQKWYDWRTTYNLNDELFKSDNTAVALSFAGFMFGLGLIMWGVLTADGINHLWFDLLDMFGMGLMGILLLSLAQWVNDRAVFHRFNVRDLIAKGNRSAGLAECGATVGTALIVMASVNSSSTSLALQIADTLIFFSCGQVTFLIFSMAYQKLTAFDIHEEIEHDNAAAGLNIGLSFVAMGILLAYAIRATDSLLAFGAWFVLSTLLLLILRKVIDWIVFPGHRLEEEISRDKNWGAALVEGAMAVIVALIVTGAF